MRTMEQYAFSGRQRKVFWSNALLQNFAEKHCFECQIGLKWKLKPITPIIIISCEVFKQNYPLEIVVLKILLNSEQISEVEFNFRKCVVVFNFAMNRRRLFVPLKIWKIFTTYISCTPTASYFYYYVTTRSFLLDAIVFSFYLFRWQHREITSEPLFNNISPGSSTIVNFPCKHKLHLSELGLYDLQFPFIFQDIPR